MLPDQDPDSSIRDQEDNSEEEPVLEEPAGWRPMPRVSRKRKATEASGINDALLVPLLATGRSRPSQQLTPIHDAQPAPPNVGQPAAASSSSALSQLVAIPNESAANTGQERSCQRMGRVANGGDAHPRDILASVEGANIVRDMHLLPGMPGHYDRACVRCPVHSGLRVFCHKSRTFGQRNRARFGQQEPVAALASWVSAASRFPDRTSHMRWMPGQDEVSTAMAMLTSFRAEE